MTHDDALRVLQDVAEENEAREQAIDHVGRCSDCFIVLARAHHIAGGSQASADRLDTLFGCTAVQRHLHVFATLTPEAVARDYPGPARHLGWCHACRERLADAMLIEDAARRGDFDEFEPVADSASWRSTVSSLGETIHELAGSVIVRVRRELGVLATVPAGLVVQPVTAGATRSSATGAGALGQRTRVELGDSGLVATLQMGSHGDQRVHLGLRVAGSVTDSLSAELRTIDGPTSTLVAAQRLAGASEVAFREVPVGRYALDIRDRVPPRRYRLQLLVDAGA
jgi:hypothetical protein